MNEREIRRFWRSAPYTQRTNGNHCRLLSSLTTFLHFISSHRSLYLSLCSQFFLYTDHIPNNVEKNQSSKLTTNPVFIFPPNQTCLHHSDEEEDQHRELLLLKTNGLFLYCISHFNLIFQIFFHVYFQILENVLGKIVRLCFVCVETVEYIYDHKI